MSGRELAKFLGPVSPSLFTWQKSIHPDAEFYYGKANQPLSGHVDILITLWTWKPDLGLMPTPGGPDRLGILPGAWSKGKHEQTYLGGFLFADADERKISVNINSPVEADVDTMATEVSRLPMFNGTPSAPFRGIMIRKQIARAVDWVLLPSLFVISLWLPNRHLRKKSARGLRRALTFAATSTVWILLFTGLFMIDLQGFRSILIAESASFLWVIPALAIACFLSALGAVVYLLLRRRVASN